MEQIIIREFLFEDSRIKFRKGLNYIVGSNNSGKTTLYNYIQFTMGLKKVVNSQFSRNLSFDMTLICDIGNQEVKFIRNTKSEFITIQYNNKSETVKYFSQKLKDIYDNLLQPSFVYENEKGAAYDIIKNSFLSELKSEITIGKNESFKKLLGINVNYMKQATNDLRELKATVKNEQKSINLLEDFINKIYERNNKKSFVNNTNLRLLIDIEYSSVIKNHKETIDFLHIAERVLIEKEEFLEAELEKRVSVFESYYRELMNRIGSENETSSFRDFFRFGIVNSNRKYSYKNYYESLCVLLTLTRHFEGDQHNGCGLLLSDLPLYDLEERIRESLIKVIKKETEMGSIQYIEFTNNKKYLSEESIIFDLDTLERYL